MAKAAAKTSSKTVSTKTSAPRAKASNNKVEQVNAQALQKLQELGIEEQLQRDLEWCLGSYRSDHNPIGLYETARKALSVFQTEKQKKTKGVTAKLISDLEKVVNERRD
ncbi:MAG TPA: hypothetical protein VFO54_02340 [Chryseosolibacter sp.]|nr:hypothetical protein [Chryseosolibacter sp.]